MSQHYIRSGSSHPNSARPAGLAVVPGLVLGMGATAGLSRLALCVMLGHDDALMQIAADN